MRALLLIAALVMAIPTARAAVFPNVLPNTKYCAAGSVAHATNYCVDATPCKQVQGYTVCLQGTPSPPANALISTFTCWSESTDYTCYNLVSNCSPYSTNSSCTEIGSPVCTPDSNGVPMTSSISQMGACISYTHTYQCTGNVVASTTTTCTTTSMLNGLDWSVASPSAANDFVQAAAGQEFARQIVEYGYDNSGQLNNIFHGVPMTCVDGWVGLKNCCANNSGGGLASNAQASTLTGNLEMSALKYGVGYAVKAGSAYVYDLMLSDAAPEFMQAGIASTANAMQSNAWGSGFSMFGFGTSAQAASGLFPAASTTQLGTSGIYFNPYAFAAAVAIQVVMQAISCTDEEKTLANLKSNNLCHPVGAYCSNEIRVLGQLVGCLETTQAFCCFNGLLAKGINEGAHSFYGLGWGIPQSPNCSGLSIAQIQGLDFTSPALANVMDPFKNEIMNKFNGNAGAHISNGSFQNNVQQNSTQGAHALCLQRQLLQPSIVCL